MNEKNESLVEEALKVYKIPSKYVFASRVDEKTGEARIVTNGGKKVIHKKGEPARFELTQTEITGEPPEQELVWNEKLNQRQNIKGLFKRIKE